MVGMDKKSVKKYIYWGIFIAFVVGSIMTGSPFNFIDMIVVRPIVNILFVILDTLFEEGDSLGNSRSGAPQKNHGGSHALLSDKGL